VVNNKGKEDLILKILVLDPGKIVNRDQDSSSSGIIEIPLRPLYNPVEEDKVLRMSNSPFVRMVSEEEEEEETRMVVNKETFSQGIMVSLGLKTEIIVRFLIEDKDNQEITTKYLMFEIIIIVGKGPRIFGRTGNNPNNRRNNQPKGG
jgi:hypothetical protein